VAEIEAISKNRLRPIRDEVYHAIKDAILKGAYKPQQRFKETDLAKTLGVSRTPIREAMRKLEIDGLVEYVPHKGTVVSGFDLSEILDIYEVRTVLETLIAKRAAENITDELIEKLKLNIKKFETEENNDTILALLDEFNELIYEASKCSKLVNLMRHTRGYFKRVRISNHTDPERRKDAILEHERIVSVLEKRDPDLAVKYTLEHIESSRKFIISKIHSKEGWQRK